jgi:hypothetical protein
VEIVIGTEAVFALGIALACLSEHWLGDVDTADAKAQALQEASGASCPASEV